MNVARSINGEVHQTAPVRRGKHCRERWHNHLDPGLNSNFYTGGQWSYEEDIVLLKEQKRLGNRWSAIVTVLTGRTENSVKNRYNCLIKKAKQTYNMELFPDENISYVLMQEFEARLRENSE